MVPVKLRTITAVIAFWALMLSLVVTDVRAEKPAIEPDALRILNRMTDFVGRLQQFSQSGSAILSFP